MQLPEMQVFLMLSDRLSLVRVPEEDLPADTMAATNPTVAIGRLHAGILGKFADFLGDHLDVLPPKNAVLSAFGSAIDIAFTAMGRPVISGLLKPMVKQSILEAAGRLYDSIVDGLTAEPRTEV